MEVALGASEGTKGVSLPIVFYFFRKYYDSWEEACVGAGVPQNAPWNYKQPTVNNQIEILQ